MKRQPQKDADQRSIEEKAFGLIMAMNAEAALKLHQRLSIMASKKSKRAAMFCNQAHGAGTTA